jgi:WD repeat-containing protein 35
MNECFMEIQKTPYECLWKLFARKALEEYDFINAEKGFLQLQDYKSLQFLKRLSMLDDKSKQRGEILAFYGRYD